MPSGHTSPFERMKKDRSHKDPFRNLATDSAQTSDRPLFSSIIKSALFALPITMACGLLLVSAMAGLAFAQADPATTVMPLSLAVLGLCSLIGGLICARRCGGAPLWCGLAFGVLFSLVTWMLSFLFGNRSGDSLSLQLSLPLSILVRAVSVGLSLLGARLGMHRQGPPRHRRKKP